jgi:hypothetical protein
MFIAPHYRIQMPKVVEENGVELWVYMVTDIEKPPIRLFCTESDDEWYLSRAEFDILLDNADMYDSTFHVDLSLIGAA